MTITDLIARLGLPADVVSIATINGKQVSDIHQSIGDGDVVMLSLPIAGG